MIYHNAYRTDALLLLPSKVKKTHYGKYINKELLNFHIISITQSIIYSTISKIILTQTMLQQYYISYFRKIYRNLTNSIEVILSHKNLPRLSNECTANLCINIISYSYITVIS